MPNEHARPGSGPPAPDYLKELRKKMKEDHEAGRLQDSAHYTSWLLEQDEELGRLKARRTVYREIAKYRPRGGKPNPPTR